MYIKFILLIQLFLIIQDTNAYITSHSRLFANVEIFDCEPCAHPFQDLHIIGTYSASPCLHVGQPLFKWPQIVTTKESNKTVKKCKVPIDIRSNDFSFDFESGIAFAKYRVCFIRQHNWVIQYDYMCTKFDNWKRSSIEIRHKVY